MRSVATATTAAAAAAAAAARRVMIEGRGWSGREDWGGGVGDGVAARSWASSRSSAAMRRWASWRVSGEGDIFIAVDRMVMGVDD